MSEHQHDRDEAELRLLDALLQEQFDTEATRTSTPGHAAPPGTQQGPNRWRLPAAAAALLGLGVVFAVAALRSRASGPQLYAQDPVTVGKTLVVPDSRAHFDRLLADVRELRLVRKQTIGAGRVIDAHGKSADRLDTVAWPEVHRVTGEQLDAWREALRASPGEAYDQNTVNDVYAVEFTLSDDRLLRCVASWDRESPRIWVGGLRPLTANDALRSLFSAAHASVSERHRIARGRVDTAEQLAALPPQTTRLDVDSVLLTRDRALALATGLEQLLVRGEAQAAGQTWQAIASLPKLRSLEIVGCTLDDAAIAQLIGSDWLRELTLRDCPGLTAQGSALLVRLRRLRRLFCVGTSFDPAVLASLPDLREFGVRLPDGELNADALEVLLRTKLERLLLVDVGPGTELSVVGGLPSLRELTIVGPIDDGDIAEFCGLKNLRRLVLRNTKVTHGGVDELRAALPACRIDWRLDQRWFDVDYAFEYEPPTEQPPGFATDEQLVAQHLGAAYAVASAAPQAKAIERLFFDGDAVELAPSPALRELRPDTRYYLTIVRSLFPEYQRVATLASVRRREGRAPHVQHLLAPLFTTSPPAQFLSQFEGTPVDGMPDRLRVTHAICELLAKTMPGGAVGAASSDRNRCRAALQWNGQPWRTLEVLFADGAIASCRLVRD